jgi:hypothetical protein
MQIARKLIPAFAMMLAVSSAAAQGAARDPERAAVRQVILELASHVQSGNWASADALFAARGAHMLADTSAMHSWAEYRDGHLKTEVGRYSNVKVTHTGVEAQVRGAAAWVVFKQEITGTPSSGAARMVGRGSAVLEKIEGRWIIVQLHMSR